MEIRDLYDKNKKATGKTFIKGEQVPKGYYYLIVAIIIENSKGEFLIQKRVPRKGGKWSITAGHPTSGQSSLEGLMTEVKEELGLDISLDKPILFKTITHNDQFFDVYYLKKDIDINEITIQKEEVDAVMWAKRTQIKEMNEKQFFHEGHYNMYLECLKHLDEK